MNPNDPRFAPPPNPNNPHPYVPYAPPQYPPPQYAPPQVAPSDNEATTIFVYGLLGLMVCAFLAPVAWMKGSTYRATCRVMEVQPNGLATAGWVLGIVGTIALVMSVLGIVAMMVLSAVS